MIEKKLIKNMVDHIFHPHKKNFIDNNLMHPERDWSIGLTIWAVLVLVGGWWSVHSYLQYSSISLENTEALTQESFIYRGSLIDVALNNYAERKKIYDDLLNKSEGINQSFVATTTLSTSSVEVLSSDNSVKAVVSTTTQIYPPLEENATKTENVMSEISTDSRVVVPAE